jgi:uncharacterized protein (UPF0332 family)
MAGQKRSVKWYIGKGLLQRTPFISRLSGGYVEKARANLVTMSILYEIKENTDARKALAVPDYYEPGEWVVISAYYSMYMATLGVLAKVNYKCSNHSAAIAALDGFFVKKELLEPQYVKMLENARLDREQVEQLELAKTRREIAQYSVTKNTTWDLAKAQKENAYKFVERMEGLIESIGKSDE